MTEPFAADINQHARHQNVVERQRVIAEAWDALVKARQGGNE